jgi:proteasome assembly chaperone (PAC2) family protein
MPGDDKPLRILQELSGLRDPALVVVFVRRNGFNSTASATLQRFAQAHDAEAVASIEPHDFFDFTVLPPSVRIEDGRRVIEWPRNELLLLRAEGAKRDVIALAGIEPHLGWQRFSDALTQFVEDLEIKTVLALRTWPAPVPHTRPVVLRLSTDSTDLAAELQLDARESNYQGALDFPGLLSTELANRGVVTAGLTAIVPNYLGLVPNPMATVALTEVLDRLAGVATDIDEVREAEANLQDRADEAMRESEELRAAVEGMEANYQSVIEELGAQRPIGDADLPDASELLRDVERFLNSEG